MKNLSPLFPVLLAFIGFVGTLLLITLNLSSDKCNRQRPGHMMVIEDTIAKVTFDTVIFKNRALNNRLNLDSVIKLIEHNSSNSYRALKILSLKDPKLDSTLKVIDSKHSDSDSALKVLALNESYRNSVLRITHQGDTLQQFSVDPKNVITNNNPDILIFSNIAAFMVAFSLGALPVMWYYRRRISDMVSNSKKRKGILIVIAWVIAVAALLLPFKITVAFSFVDLYNATHILFGSMGGYITMILSGLAIIASAYTLYCMLYFGQLAILCSVPFHAGGKDWKGFAARYEDLTDGLNNLLTVVGVILSLGIITTFWHAKAIKAEYEILGFDLYSKDFIVGYGLYFTSILIIVYVPVHLIIKNRGIALAREMDNDAALTDVQRTSFRNQLVLSKSTLDNLKTALSIAGPFLTAMLTLIDQ